MNPILRPLIRALLLAAMHRPVEARAQTPDTLYDLKTLLAPATYLAPLVSPDGRYVSYLGPVDGALNLFVAPVENPRAARPLTRRTGRGLQAFDVSGNVLYRWTPDSKHLIFPVDQDGNEKWNLYQVDLDTGAEQNLTPLPGIAVELLAFSDTNPNLALIAVKERSPFIPNLYRLDLTTGNRTLVLENQDIVGVFPDRLLRPRIGLKIGAGGRYQFFKYTSSSWAPLFELGTEDAAGLNASVYQKIFAISQDNTSLYMYDTEGRNAAALVAVNLDTGRRTVVASDPRVDIAGVLYHPVTNAVQAYATNWTRTQWHVLDPAIRADMERLQKFADAELKVLSRSRDDRVWIVQYMGSDAPIGYYIYRRPSKQLTKLFVSAPALEGLHFSKLHPYVIKSRDGLDLVSYYLLPPWTDPKGTGKPSTPQPAVMLVHGGPSDERAQYAFGPFVHWLANRGYAVLYVNYRGSAGFGKQFMNGQRLEWGGKMHTDLLDQVEWAVKEGIVRRDRVAIMGGSYGGYATLVGMTMTPDVFACGVDLVGPSNLERFMPHWDVDVMSRVVGDPRTEEGRQLLRSRSPINFAQNTKHPVLIGQGANDSRVPQYQSDTVVALIRKAGVPVIYAVYPDEGHGLLRPANSFSFWAIAEQFLARCLGGRAAPLAGQFEGSSIQVPVGADYIPGLAELLAQRR